MIQDRESVLKKAMKTAEREMNHFPEGRLRVSQNKNYARYFCVSESGDTTGTYIKKNDFLTAKQLAQKDYNSRFREDVQLELETLRTIGQYLERENADETYRKLSECRQNLVKPYIMSDDEYVAQWLSRPYKKNTFFEENKIYMTKNGECVRSKSEALLADMFLDLGIPYRYEEEIQLRRGKKRYPDFTLLKKKTREVIYLEHFGLLDDEDYRNSALTKMEEYRKNGIYPGKNLLFTYETKECPLDISGIRKMMKDLLL